MLNRRSFLSRFLFAPIAFLIPWKSASARRVDSSKQARHFYWPGTVSAEFGEKFNKKLAEIPDEGFFQVTEYINNGRFIGYNIEDAIKSTGYILGPRRDYE